MSEFVAYSPEWMRERAAFCRACAIEYADRVATWPEKYRVYSASERDRFLKSERFWLSLADEGERYEREEANADAA